MAAKSIFAKIWTMAGITVLAGFASATSARAQSLESFFHGQPLTIVVGSTASSGYDFYARLLARHYGNHLPGQPTVIVRNMPGAGGLTALRNLYDVAPKDGSTIGTVSRGIPFEPLLGSSKVEFDPLKFVWIGSMANEITLFVSWHTAKVKTAKDLFTKELILGTSGAGSDADIVSSALNGLVGTKFKRIPGYDSASSAALAMERGEIEGVYWTWGGLKAFKTDWIRDKKLNYLFQSGGTGTPPPELAKVPFYPVLAKTKDQRDALDLMFARDGLGRPFFGPPGIPADRAKALQDGFNATIKDPALLADAKKTNTDINLVTGAEMVDILRKAYATPTDTVERTRAAMSR
jgi:tripartite-type tricarboxylate transporter receptor subunit TctC